MTVFEPLLVVLVVAAVVTLVRAIVAAVCGRRRQALVLLCKLGVGTAAYLGIVVTVSLASPQRVLALGEDWCFDDWCVTVDGVTTATELGPTDHRVRAHGVFHVVRLHLSNQGLGRPQRASSAALHLLDERGRWHDVSLEGQRALEGVEGPAAPLTSTVNVGAPLAAVQVFDAPRDVRIVGLVVEHPVGPGPGLFVIGDADSLLHAPTIVRLD